MVFSSPTFLLAFLPLVLLGLAVVRVRWFQAWWLLGLSMLFYVWGAGIAVLILLAVTAASFAAGYLPWQRLKAAGAAGRWALGGVIVLLLSPILFFKYLPPLTGAVGIQAFASVAIPLGISFFTFHAVSYVVDIYRGTIERETNLRDYALYLFVFPHQIAGPIVRFSEIRVELRGFRDATLPQFGYGFTRFAWGLAKKVLVADQVGRLADIIFAANADGAQLSAASAWLGAILYAVQIYFDFSGYSDMAIGLAIMLGFRFPENFSQPYRSISVTDFWRRWHMTLSRWFRDYVYFPMGGNRHGVGREYIALVTVFLLTSLWHGGTLNFLIWGGLHSAALIMERVTRLRDTERFAVIRRVLMLVFVFVSWIPFRTHDLNDLWRYWRAMAGANPGWLTSTEAVNITPFVVLALIVAGISVIGPRTVTGFGSVFGTRSVDQLERFRFGLAIPIAIALLGMCIVMVLWSDFSPFLYFQF